MLRRLAAWLFRLAGWTVSGPVPHNLPKFVLFVAPHATSNDFYVGVGARAYINIWIYYLAKKELFRPAPVSWFLKKMGGYPVDRSRHLNFVDSVVALFNEHEEFRICVTPEGTRKDVSELKTGFYYMALGAQVPIVFCGFDYGRKAVLFGEPFYPTGNWDADKKVMAAFFNQVQGTRKSWIRNYLNT
ncbi:1-acyl-sn-glycerol-3-phosphate acyltransferase [Siphonobacter aquaeclarae]|uniref:Acyltransferase n=1 Tax=Siphonobacter aquaeclarae TaxID=563176 RepID=A0A1G9THQ3_9BACT|nr:1-acyl-sn-glycerol-3-phosphate acyltransferase [Siphonobacter aquaeclarae]SDM47289.1 Acyltransferase [Siphonobacter aquaeclarae]